jgi:hypothetical protein
LRRGLITRKKHLIPPVNLILDGKALEMVNAYRYLGVWITNDLSWTKQPTLMGILLVLVYINYSTKFDSP